MRSLLLLAIAFVLVLHVLTVSVSGIYVPVGFHGTDNNAKYSMLKEIKTQKAVGTQTSQIMGYGTYFGLSPAIANQYAQMRCNQRGLKPSTNAAVLIIGVEDKYAREDADFKTTPIKSTKPKEEAPFFAAVNKLVTTCKAQEDEALKKKPNTQFKCGVQPDKFDFTPASCPFAEFVVLDDVVVKIPNQVVAMGYYNVYEINAKEAPQKGAYLIEQHKTKYWFYPNINIITNDFKDHQIFERVRQFIQVSAAACSTAEGWVLKTVADAANTVLAETESHSTHKFSHARLKSLQQRTNNKALQP